VDLEKSCMSHNDQIRESSVLSCACHFAVVMTLIVLFSCTSINNQNPGWKEYMYNPQDKSQLDLYHETHGTGAPILLLHGFGGSVYSWRYLVPSLSKHYKLLLVDLKGFGSSPKPHDKHYSVYDQAILIYKFILQHDLRNLTIIGHSLGGIVALVTALYLNESDPSRLIKLILIDSVGYEQQFPRFIEILRTPIVGPLGLYLLPSKLQVKHVLKLAYYDDNKISDDAVAAYAKTLDMPGGRYALLQTAKQIVPVDIEGLTLAYHTITVPTLILWGQEDEIVPLEVGKLLHQAIPHSELFILDQCGHHPHEEKADEVLTILENFLEN
jgi:pimeloyl-ACP methyl ester carboxylesterase